MTREEFTNRLPKFTSNAFTLPPPFMFNGVSARVFPLRASLEVLQQLCDGYLNIVPPHAGRFRAFLPYVYLMALDYGQMADVHVVGWVSQIEVFFGVPVEWYKLVNGQWIFHDWAVVTPYIFVNDNFSMPLGRSAYGFPKVLANVTPSTSRWLKDPMGTLTLASFETAVFPETYKGTNLETRVFLEIDRKAPMSNFRVPFDPQSPIAPWVIASNFADAMGGFGRDAQWMAQSMRLFPAFRLGWKAGQPEGATNPATLQQMMAGIAPALMPGGSAFLVNSINLKQFRRAEAPERVCFQALTNAGMRTTGFNGAGLLGEDRTILGDLSGGHTVRLYEHSSLPIARTLGLEVQRRWKCHGLDVAELKPVMPFWLDMDLRYEQGSNIAWRTDDGIWKDDTGAPFDPSEKPATGTNGPEYNASASTGVGAITGPFSFTGTTIRVMPLLADLAVLQGFLDGYLNDPLKCPIADEHGKVEKVRFTVWARPPMPVFEGGVALGGGYAYVYLTASSFAAVTSGTNNVGDWAKYELSFMIPVKWERWNPDAWNPEKGEKGVWEIAGVGMVPGMSLMDDDVAAYSRLEVQGIAADVANFVRPESVWLSGGDTDFRVVPEQTLLRVDAEVLPAFNVGQKASTEPLIEIRGNDADAGFEAAQSRDLPWEWAEVLRQELGTKKSVKAAFPIDTRVARALSLELLGNQTPFCIYTMKQFRDVTDPLRACYQSVVRVPRVLREVFDVREIEATLVVRIHDYPSLSIVKTLGIVAGMLPECGSGVIFAAQAIRPFFIRATVDEPLAERVLWRSGTPDWTLLNNAFQTMLSKEAGPPEITLDFKAKKQNEISVNFKSEALQDQMDPCRMAAVLFEARGQGDAIGKGAARQAVARVDPQIVIESVLSREWGNFDPNNRWRKGRAELLQKLGTLPQGGDLKAMVESLMYAGLNNQLADRPGAVASNLSAEDVAPVAPGATGNTGEVASNNRRRLKRSGGTFSRRSSGANTISR